jgi:RNA polymerase sigma factor (sigma-70 family)
MMQAMTRESFPKDAPVRRAGRAGSGDLGPLDDAGLVALCLTGDATAWEELVGRYRRLVYSIPMRYGMGADASADVYQAVWTRLFEHLDGLKDHGKLATWLITTTRRECWRVSNRLRREAPIGEVGDDDEWRIPELEDERPSADEEQIRLAEQQRVHAAVETLPERSRELVKLLYFTEDRPSYEEISRRLGIPVPSIGPTRARCLEKLRRLLA